MKSLTTYLIDSPLTSIFVLLLGGVGGPLLFVEGFTILALVVSFPAMVIVMEIFLTVYQYVAVLKPGERYVFWIFLIIPILPIMIGSAMYYLSNILMKYFGLISVVEGVAMFCNAYLLQKYPIPIPRIGKGPLRLEDQPDEYKLQLWWICRGLGQLGLAGVGFGIMILFKAV